ncbi:MAG TPA: YbgF trimerization domain-containing protein, partial [Casimicrobiaceae bacterium]|nr:YbgF trimerization domain-containing protein [Casimicrobiaceae bacterium]
MSATSRASPRAGGVLAPLVLAFALLAQLAALPARAALFDDDEARRRIEDLRARVDRLEGSLQERVRVLEDTVKGQGLVDLLRDVEQIKTDLAKLRGQNEVLTYELEQAQKRQRDLYLDLDSRLRKLETGSGAPPAGGQGGPPPAGDNAAPLPGSPAPPGAGPPTGAGPPPPGPRGALSSATDVVGE